MIFLLAAAAVMLAACAPVIRQHGSLVPSSSVYIQPQNPLDLSNKKLLVAPIALYSPQANQWVPAVTRMVQDIFSQERVFRVIVVGKERFESEDQFVQYAEEQGFDYVLIGSVPPVVFPSGNTSGWVGFDMRIVSAGSGLTIWHIYGQASLQPAPTRWSILGDSPHAPAPSVSDGFTAILRQMACIINRQPSSSPCDRP